MKLIFDLSVQFVFVFSLPWRKTRAISHLKKQKQKTVMGTIFKIYSEVSSLKWDSSQALVPVSRPKLSFNICFVFRVITPEISTGQVCLLQLF